MNKSRIISVVSSLSTKLLEYDDGDMFLLSEMVDDIKEIVSLVASDNLLHKLVSISHNILLSVMKMNDVPNFVETVSKSIDLLSRKLDIQRGNSEVITEEINDFVDEQKGFIESRDDTDSTKNKKSNKKTKDNKQQQVNEEPRLKIDSHALEIFLVEAEERLNQAQDIVLQLEKDNGDSENKELLNTLFRIFHTIKGECGFLRLARLGELAHNLENLLDLLRDGKIQSNSAVIDILFKGIDLSSNMLEALKDGDITVFNKIKINGFVSQITDYTSHARVSIGEVLKEDGLLTGSEVEKVLHLQKESAFTKKFGEIAIEENLITEEQINNSLEEQKEIVSGDNDSSHRKNVQINKIIKVKASQINYLVDMVGELIIVVNQLNDQNKNVTQLKKITRQVQDTAMKLRAVPVKNLFVSARRVARDTAKRLNKEVEIETLGDTLEIDRNIVETLDEPIMHIIRNAIGHGIESQDERIKKGKDKIGKLLIQAERSGNNVVISIEDDGTGLSKKDIIEKALERNIVSKNKINTLTDEDIYNFIFVPGFSTAKSVDSVSGRGVGLDIVKSVVADHRGKVIIKTEKGKFTRFSLSFPLSMAIIDGMIIKVGTMLFIIPISSVLESVIIQGGTVFEVKNATQVINIRGEVIPVVDLRKFFNTEYTKPKLSILVTLQDKKYSLVIDELIAKKEVVIKPLNKKFEKIKGISSGAILGKGKIGFILDIETVVGV